MAGLAPVAGGPGGDIDALVPQHPHQHLALVPGQGQGQNVGGLPPADLLRLGDPGPELLQGVRLQGLQVGDGVAELGTARLAGGGEGGDLSGGLGARAEAVLLAAPQNQGLQGHSGADVQGADPLGCVDLVTAEGEQIHPQLGGGEG